MKILFLITEDWAFISHRLHLAKYAKNKGHEVDVLCKINNGFDDVDIEGITILPWRITRKSFNPFIEIIAIFDLVKSLKKSSPDIIHAVGLKPVIYSLIAILFSKKKNRVLALGGLGYVFNSNSIKAKFIKPLIKIAYKMSFSSGNTRIILQNNSDKEILIKNNIVDPKIIRIVKGAGVEVKKFLPTKENNKNIKILLPARVLWDKGVQEFVEVAKTIKIKFKNVTFILAGDRDIQNPECIPLEKLNEWVNLGLIKWLGHYKKMEELYSEVNIICLPSYREGLSKALLEASSCSRPIVTFDVPGCRDVVEDGFNGFLVPFGNLDILKNSIIKLIESKKLRFNMGKNGRKKILNEFSSEIINKQTMAIWKELVK